MANLEENFLQNTHSKPLLYLRYIDDIFLLRTHGKEKLLQFQNDYNSEDHDIFVYLFLFYFYLYIYAPDSQESDGGVIHV